MLWLQLLLLASSSSILCPRAQAPNGKELLYGNAKQQYEEYRTCVDGFFLSLDATGKCNDVYTTNATTGVKPNDTLVLNNSSTWTGLRTALTYALEQCNIPYTKNLSVLAPQSVFIYVLTSQDVASQFSNNGSSVVFTKPSFIRDWGRDLVQIAHASDPTYINSIISSPPPAAPLSPDSSALFPPLDNISLAPIGGGDPVLPSFTFDGFFVDPVALADLAVSGSLKDLTPSLDNFTAWTGIENFFRDSVVMNGGQILSLPFGGLVHQLFVRNDVLTYHNLSAPVTWDQFLEVAAQVNGTFTNTVTNVTDVMWGVCLQRRKECFNGFDLATIWSSYVQTKGTAQGAYFDPVDMKPLVNNAGMARAMQIYQDLLAYDPNDNNVSTCGSLYNQRFLAGQCAMTLDRSLLYKYSNLQGTGQSLASGISYPITQIAPLPGTTEVWDRVSNTMQNCTQDLCPFATTDPSVTDEQGNLMLINRAPYLAIATISGAINNRTDAVAQLNVMKLLSYLSDANRSSSLVTSPLSELGPVRTEHFDEKIWTNVGYNRSSVRQYLQDLQLSFNHPNNLLEVRTIDGIIYRQAFDWAADNISTGAVPIPQTMLNFETNLLRTFNASHPRWDLLTQLYRSSLKYKPSPPPPMPPSPPPAVPAYFRAVQKKVKKRSYIIGFCASFGTIFLLLAFVLGIAKYQKWKYGHVRFLDHARGWQPVVHPGVGPDSTLVVTDMEGSTALWEGLDAAVMDQVFTLHHDCMRKCTVMWRGYESQTEGDSFILAFHNPAAAVSFAVSVQAALMEVPWPPELLALESCKPVWVTSVPDPHLRNRGSLDGAYNNNTNNIKSSVSLLQSPNTAAPTSTASLAPTPMISSAVTAAAALEPPRRRLAAIRRFASSMSGRPWAAMSRLSASVRSASGISFQPSTELSTLAFSPSGTFASKPPSIAGSTNTQRGGALPVRLGKFSEPLAAMCSFPAASPHAFAAASAAPNIGGGTGSVGSHHPQRQSSPSLWGGVNTSGGATKRSTGSVSNAAGMPSSFAGGGAAAAAASAGPLPPPPPPPPAQCYGEVLQAGWRIVDSRGGLPRRSGSSCGHGMHSGNLGSPVPHSGLGGAPTSQNYMSQNVSGLASKPMEPPAQPPQLMWCGVRVRIGIHTGIQYSSDLVYSEVAARMKYSGEILEGAKAVSDAARGGMTLLSAAALQRLDHEFLTRKVVMLCLGRHLLRSERQLTALLYTVTSPRLLPRISTLQTPRTRRCLVPGILRAPLYCLSYAHIVVEGRHALLDAPPVAAAEAFGSFRSITHFQLLAMQGYKVSEALGSIAAVFSTPLAAMGWALQVQDDLWHYQWSNDVLEQEVCALVTAPDDGRVLLRGPRVKAAVTWGPAKAQIDPVTGHMCYDGKLLRQADKLQALGLPNMVLASQDAAWTALAQVPSAFENHLDPAIRSSAPPVLTRTPSGGMSRFAMAGGGGCSVMGPSGSMSAGQIRTCAPSRAFSTPGVPAMYDVLSAASMNNQRWLLPLQVRLRALAQAQAASGGSGGTPGSGASLGPSASLSAMEQPRSAGGARRVIQQTLDRGTVSGSSAPALEAVAEERRATASGGDGAAFGCTSLTEPATAAYATQLAPVVSSPGVPTSAAAPRARSYDRSPSGRVSGLDPESDQLYFQQQQLQQSPAYMMHTRSLDGVESLPMPPVALQSPLPLPPPVHVRHSLLRQQAAAAAIGMRSASDTGPLAPLLHRLMAPAPSAAGLHQFPTQPMHASASGNSRAEATESESRAGEAGSGNVLAAVTNVASSHDSSSPTVSSAPRLIPGDGTARYASSCALDNMPSALVDARRTDSSPSPLSPSCANDDLSSRGGSAVTPADSSLPRSLLPPAFSSAGPSETNGSAWSFIGRWPHVHGMPPAPGSSSAAAPHTTHRSTSPPASSYDFGSSAPESDLLSPSSSRLNARTLAHAHHFDAGGSVSEPSSVFIDMPPTSERTLAAFGGIGATSKARRDGGLRVSNGLDGPSSSSGNMPIVGNGLLDPPAPHAASMAATAVRRPPSRTRNHTAYTISASPYSHTSAPGEGHTRRRPRHSATTGSAGYGSGADDDSSATPVPRSMRSSNNGRARTGLGSGGTSAQALASHTTRGGSGGGSGGGSLNNEPHSGPRSLMLLTLPPSGASNSSGTGGSNRLSNRAITPIQRYAMVAKPGLATASLLDGVDGQSGDVLALSPFAVFSDEPPPPELMHTLSASDEERLPSTAACLASASMRHRLGEHSGVFVGHGAERVEGSATLVGSGGWDADDQDFYDEENPLDPSAMSADGMSGMRGGLFGGHRYDDGVGHASASDPQQDVRVQRRLQQLPLPIGAVRGHSTQGYSRAGGSGVAASSDGTAAVSPFLAVQPPSSLGAGSNQGSGGAAAVVAARLSRRAGAARSVDADAGSGSDAVSCRSPGPQDTILLRPIVLRRKARTPGGGGGGSSRGGSVSSVGGGTTHAVLCRLSGTRRGMPADAQEHFLARDTLNVHSTGGSTSNLRIAPGLLAASISRRFLQPLSNRISLTSRSSFADRNNKGSWTTKPSFDRKSSAGGSMGVGGSSSQVHGSLNNLRKGGSRNIPRFTVLTSDGELTDWLSS